MSLNENPLDDSSLLKITDQLENLTPVASSTSISSTTVGLLAHTIEIKGSVTINQTTGQGPEQNVKPMPSPPIWFNVVDPIESFCGRIKFLDTLHDRLLENEKEGKLRVTVLSQVKIVSGLGGIGKTETARQYILKFGGASYTNVIWINSENRRTMANAFADLAIKIQVPTTNYEGRPKGINQLVGEVYEKICRQTSQRTLLVFDNAEGYESNQHPGENNKTVDGIQPFLPQSLPGLYRKPIILATSRNQEWTSSFGKIQVLELEVLTQEETIGFIFKELDLELKSESESESDPNPNSNSYDLTKEVEELSTLIGGLPLALQQATAYIKEQMKLHRHLSTPYRISHYVRSFNKSMMKKLQNFPHIPGSSSTVYLTWNVTFEKIQNLENGPLAIKILELLSFLYADDIPTLFLFEILSSHPQMELAAALNLLEKYSLIKSRSGASLIIHRQLQFVILEYLHESNLIQDNAHIIQSRSLDILDNNIISVTTNSSSKIFLNVQQFLSNPFDFIQEDEGFVDLMYSLSVLYWKAGKYEDAFNLATTLHDKDLKMFGEYHENTLHALHHMALILGVQGKSEESLELNRIVLEKEESSLGKDHVDTITTKHNISVDLMNMQRYEESLEMFRQVIGQYKRVLGERDRKTLNSENQMCRCLSHQGNYVESLRLNDDVERRQRETLGPDHLETILTRHNRAFTMMEQGDLEGALGIFRDVLQAQLRHLGINHPSNLSVRTNIATVLNRQGMKEEALKLSKQVYEQQRLVLGENHPDTVKTRTRIQIIEKELMTLK